MEEDYVNLCVDAADILDHAPDYAARCGKWADQVPPLLSVLSQAPCITESLAIDALSAQMSEVPQYCDNNDVHCDSCSVSVCVDAVDILGHAPDYAARCGKWADQVHARMPRAQPTPSTDERL